MTWVSVLAMAAAGGCTDRRAEMPVDRVSLVETMSPGEAAGFKQAIALRTFDFPADHGPHLGFQTEWWYFTGNLRRVGPAVSDSSSEEGRFGFQLTFFRSALSPRDDQDGEGDSSAWRTNQIFMAHFALSDEASGRFDPFERFARGAAGLAGAETAPFRLWLEDWSAESLGEETFPLRLLASEDRVAIDLTVAPGKPPVLQGEQGLSRKGERPGSASYYYSLTRLPTTGTVRFGEESWQVEGSSWMDREWSTGSLEPGQTGWDWFALQLSDGSELMLYQLRRDGRTDRHSAGSLVAADGSYRILVVDETTIAELDTWASPTTGAVYPTRWRLTDRAAGFDLEVEPIFADQEHVGSVIYWEGAVSVSGTTANGPVTGEGYVELTGYDAESVR